jgi:hypothetical protein
MAVRYIFSPLLVWCILWPFGTTYFPRFGVVYFVAVCFYGNLVNVEAVWYIFSSFWCGIFCGHLFLLQFGNGCGHLVNIFPVCFYGNLENVVAIWLKKSGNLGFCDRSSVSLAKNNKNSAFLSVFFNLLVRSVFSFLINFDVFCPNFEKIENCKRISAEGDTIINHLKKTKRCVSRFLFEKMDQLLLRRRTFIRIPIEI